MPTAPGQHAGQYPAPYRHTLIVFASLSVLSTHPTFHKSSKACQSMIPS